ncbi:MAG: hypothetical protein JW938_02315 [Candidatus Omnitrophica bacterium]|nr:hypothetical protein [Candidatus Omnitrophota bacterium]
MRNKIIVLLALLLFTQGTFCYGNSLYNTTPVPEDIKEQPSSLHGDFFSEHLWEQGERYLYVDRIFQALLFMKRPAKNILPDGSVPDSAFFTNRIGISAMTDDAIARGNVSDSGPDMSGPWTVLKPKFDGLSAGFFIKDGRGTKFLIKLDLASYPELNSSSEIMGARLFHAIGYNVPEYTIVRFPITQLQFKEGLTWYDKTGFKVPFDQKALETLLRNCYIDREGMYRASASKFIEGKILGPMSLRDNRSIDPRNQIPHEDRRELRGMKVFCAWINHFDHRRSNTLDTLIADSNGWYIKHYILDFNDAFGAHIKGPKYPETGHEYVFSVDEVLKSLLTLGFYKRPWVRVDKIYPETGYFTNVDFDPAQWTTHIPNYAFQNMDKEDAAWAAGILSRFTDSNIRATVEAGMITSETAKEDLIRKLIERRNILIDYWGSE